MRFHLKGKILGKNCRTFHNFVTKDEVSQDHSWDLFFFLPCRAACGIFVPQPGIEPVPLASGASSPKHWTTREVP